jgi:hypothetical protein
MNKIVTSLAACGVALSLVGCASVSGAQPAASVSSSSNMVAGPGAGATNSAENPDVPGATGRSIVPGDNSSLSGDAAATMMQRTGRV